MCLSSYRDLTKVCPKEWHVIAFIALMCPSKIWFLLTSQIISVGNDKHILSLKNASLIVRPIMHLLEPKKDVNHREFPFLEGDICKLFTKVWLEVAENDASSLVEHFKSFKEENAEFWYVLQVHGRTRIKHMV